MSRGSAREQATSEYLLARGAPEAIALIDRSGRHTYADLRASTSCLVSAIGTWNLPQGARVGIVAPNSLFWVAAYLAVLHSGCVAVPLPTTLTPQDMRTKAGFAGCAGLLVDRSLRSRFADVLKDVDHSADDSSLEVGRASRLPRAESVSLHDDAVLVFTSGTTSNPRAVRVSHGNLQANTDDIVQYLQIDEKDRMLVVLPFSYCYGASLLHTHLRVGASLSICESFAFPQTVIEAIDRDRCTGLAGVPSTYQRLLKASTFGTKELSSLRHLQQAGGRLPQATLDMVAEAQPHARLFVMYGQTEATARLSYLAPQLRTVKPGSIGRGLSHVSLRITDDAGRDVGVGDVGEIRATGPSITKGYWNDPEGTKEKFVDGELRTGDLGTVDDGGYFYIVDRRADFIKSWGVRVSSHEVEEAVAALPGVVSVSVVGRPDPDAGEAIVVFYTARDDFVVAPEQVLLHCRKVLSRNLLPREAHRVDEIPLNGNGKVLKSVLKDRALALYTEQTRGTGE